jgi:hypothetical protein
MGQNIVLVVSWISQHIANYSALGNYTLPDGCVAHLYRTVNLRDCSNASASNASSEYSRTSWQIIAVTALGTSQHIRLAEGARL